VQTKVDIVDEERALKSYDEIREFVRGTVAENAPIVPVSAIHCTNMDALISAIEQHIPTPKRSDSGEPRFFIARSFDVNKPGTEIAKLQGGVIGGSVTSGIMRIGDEIEIKPGASTEKGWLMLKTNVVDIIQSGKSLQEAHPGGLVAIQTDLDPAITRSDGIAGNVAGKGLPQVVDVIKIETDLFDHVIGIEGFQKVEPIRTNDVLMITAGIAKTVGRVNSARAKTCELNLKLPVCVEKGGRVSLSKQIQGRWHLVGWGKIL
jgi:translation initiation factor 2 subunit 3